MAIVQFVDHILPKKLLLILDNLHTNFRYLIGPFKRRRGFTLEANIFNGFVYWGECAKGQNVLVGLKGWVDTIFLWSMEELKLSQ